MDRKKVVVITITMAVIVGAFLSLYLNRSGRPPKIVLNSYEALGEVTAEETAKLLDQKGKVVVITHDTSQNPSPAQEAQLKAFGDALKRKGGVTVASTEKFKQTPPERMATGGAVPRERFLQVLDAYPQVDAIVLFVAFPSLTEADFARLKQTGAKLVLIAGYRPAYKNLLAGRAIHLAIVPRFDSGSGNKEPQTAREWFDRDYVIITPDNLANLPY